MSMSDIDYQMHQLYKVLKALEGAREDQVTVTQGVLMVEVCPDGCCHESLDVQCTIDALGELLGIKEMTPEEVAAEEKRLFEEGRKKFLEKHPECMSENARGPKDVEAGETGEVYGLDADEEHYAGVID